MQFHPQFLFTTQFINMCTHEVSVEDVPQRNELVVDEGGSQDISEAVEEPPAKRSKIVEETLQMKDVEINWLRKQIKDYARERREMMKYINYIETLLHVSCTPHSKANQSWIN